MPEPRDGGSQTESRNTTPVRRAGEILEFCEVLGKVLLEHASAGEALSDKDARMAIAQQALMVLAASYELTRDEALQAMMRVYGSPFDSLSQQIENLYSQIDKLAATIRSDEARAELAEKFAELRQLQQEEADEVARMHRATRCLPPGMGWAALERADELLNAYEKPAAGSDT